MTTRITITSLPEVVDASYWTKTALTTPVPDSVGTARDLQTGFVYQAAIINNVLYVKAIVKRSFTSTSLEYVADPTLSLPDFKYSPWVVDNLMAITPSFSAEYSLASNNTIIAGHCSEIVFKSKIDALADPNGTWSYVDEENKIAKIFKYRTWINKILIEGDVVMYTDQDIVDITIHTRNKHAEPINIHSMLLTLGEEMIVTAAEKITYAGNSQWICQLFSGKTFGPESALSLKGSILCRGTSGYSDVESSTRLLNLLNRKNFRLETKLA